MKVEPRCFIARAVGISIGVISTTFLLGFIAPSRICYGLYQAIPQEKLQTYDLSGMGEEQLTDCLVALFPRESTKWIESQMDSTLKAEEEAMDAAILNPIAHNPSLNLRGLKDGSIDFSDCAMAYPELSEMVIAADPDKSFEYQMCLFAISHPEEYKLLNATMTSGAKQSSGYPNVSIREPLLTPRVVPNIDAVTDPIASIEHLRAMGIINENY